MTRRKNEPENVQAPAEPERPAIGAPFNPYYVLVRGEFNRAVLSSTDLDDSQARLLLLLADQCEKLGYDIHSQDKLARKCGWKPRKLRRHIAELKKAGLINVICPDGKNTFTAILYHSMFGNCSLYDRSNLAYQVGQTWPTRSAKFGLHMDLPHGSFHGLGNSTFDVGTSIGEKQAAPVVENANNNGRKKRRGTLPITNRLETPQVSADAKSFWFSLSPTEKRLRMEQVHRAAKWVEHFLQHIDSPNQAVARQADHELKRYLGRVRALGFYIPGHEPKGKA